MLTSFRAPARLVALMALTAGLTLLAVAALAHHATGGEVVQRIAARGGLLAVLGLVPLLIVRPPQPDLRRLSAVAVGLWPFCAFGAFLWWQIGLSHEQREACTVARDAEACETLAHRRHRRGHHDDAAILHDAACTLERGRSCFSLGGLRLQGHLGAPDPVGARAEFERGCLLDHPQACARLGTMRRLGQGGPVDTDGARDALQAACRASNANACAELELIDAPP
ncbi:MAG: sel1 repeat family protein [Deltaproteobacteria bacterium]|nr:MAG: sel1 repeat family protein [Deltaproteobacteria bacterium]